MRIEYWEDIHCEVHIEEMPNSFEFTVFQILSWSENKKTKEYDVIDEKEVLFKGLIKWDACSHIYFGDEGYIHLCGGRSWFIFMEATKRVWEIAMKELPKEHSKDMFDLHLFPAVNKLKE